MNRFLLTLLSFLAVLSARGATSATLLARADSLAAEGLYAEAHAAADSAFAELSALLEGERETRALRAAWTALSEYSTSLNTKINEGLKARDKQRVYELYGLQCDTDRLRLDFVEAIDGFGSTSFNISLYILLTDLSGSRSDPQAALSLIERYYPRAVAEDNVDLLDKLLWNKKLCYADRCPAGEEAHLEYIALLQRKLAQNPADTRVAQNLAKAREAYRRYTGSAKGDSSLPSKLPVSLSEATNYISSWRRHYAAAGMADSVGPMICRALDNVRPLVSREEFNGLVYQTVSYMRASALEPMQSVEISRALIDCYLPDQPFTALCLRLQQIASTGDRGPGETMDDLLAEGARRFGPKSDERLVLLAYAARDLLGFHLADAAYCERFFAEADKAFRKAHRTDSREYANLLAARFRHLTAAGRVDGLIDVCNKLLQANSASLVTLYCPRFTPMPYMVDAFAPGNLPSDGELLAALVGAGEQLGNEKYNAFALNHITTSLEHSRGQLQLMGVNRWSTWDLGRQLQLAALLAGASDSPDVHGAAYDAALFVKGLRLYAEGAVGGLIERSDNPSARAALADYRSLQRQADSIAASGGDVSALRKQAERMSERLFKMSQKFGDYTGFLDAGWPEVQRALAADEAAVEFLTDGANYYALVLTASGKPRMRHLCEAASLDTIAPAEQLETLHSLVWQPIEDAFGGARRVYFSPAGTLYGLPIESADLAGRELYRVSNTRRLAERGREAHEGGEAVLMGGIEYDIFATEAAPDSATTRASADGATYLPGTLAEVKAIAATLGDNGESATVLTGLNATEEAVKALSGKDISLLHISTHGYCDSAATDGNADEDTALARSALLMAGANNTLIFGDMPEGREDGLLTAREIARLDLANVDLVVLSACSTGLGNISEEGVYGLQRGFKKAGAGAIVMSLWEVDDAATRQLMDSFYSGLYHGKSAHRALEEAKRAVRGTPGWEDPGYWAAFILLDGVEGRGVKR